MVSAFTAIVNGSCRGSTDEYYGCLSLTVTTDTNDTFLVCPVLPGRIVDHPI